MAFTVVFASDSVQVYDSAYSDLDLATKDVITRLFSTASCQLVPVGKQQGGNDCCLYAIAIATALAHTIDPATVIFDQAMMRSHLIKCIEEDCFSLFPVIAQC